MTIGTPNDKLCLLCRAGKVFEVEDWLRAGNKPDLNPRLKVKWAMGIAIENRNHSLVEVLLRNGFPADEKTVLKAVKHRRLDMIELMLKYGADLKKIPFSKVVEAGNPAVVQLFFDHGADLYKDYPFYRGLIFETKVWLGFFKRYLPQHPDLQTQADMALRYFVEKENLRGVALMLWGGANPRNSVIDPDSKYEIDRTSLEAAAYQGNLQIIKMLKPDPKADDLNELLRLSIYKADLELVRYWVGLGADVNHQRDEAYWIHPQVVSMGWQRLGISNEICRSQYLQNLHYDARRFLKQWFAFGAKWPSLTPVDRGRFRDCLKVMDDSDVMDLIEVILDNEAMPARVLLEVFNVPSLKKRFPEIKKFAKDYIDAKARRRGGAPYVLKKNRIEDGWL